MLYREISYRTIHFLEKNHYI